MNDLLLLEKSRPQDLPADILHWLDPTQVLPPNVHYIRAHIPMPFVLYAAAVLPLFGFALLLLGTLVMRIVFDTLTFGHLIVFLIAIPIFWGAAIWLSIIGKRAKRLREEHQQEKNRIGYFLSKERFLNFDGQHVWLLPKEIVESVFIKRNPKGNASAIF